MIRKFIIVSLLLAATSTFAGEVQIAVAANFSVPIKKIAANFQEDTGHKTVITTITKECAEELELALGICALLEASQVTLLVYQ